MGQSVRENRLFFVSVCLHINGGSVTFAGRGQVASFLTSE
ncbi:hypothetical protein BACINT_02889 [Bacteroides intestinalis DSM 17393]|uniref:Uncharacterized protein n=1 Tax=Bacteroides intestinalis DSM 17393 TaxID=471870 RepID=B3CGU1_9BACE|nr:hypothetical protein BACINT_02889 [Bacteroides intestinalis DSM 17393]